MELELELAVALESNPLLDMTDGDADFDESGESEPADVGETDASPAESASESSADDDGPLDLSLEHNEYRGTPTDEDGMEPQDAEAEDLRDHLLWQLNLTPMSPRDRTIATAIIEAVDDDGYLTEPGEALAQSVSQLFSVSADEVEAVRHRVQRFDPLGVASRTLRECLLVQLEACSRDTPAIALAEVLVDQHLDQLARNDRGKLCQKLRASADELDGAITLIRSLNPKPGAGHSAAPAEYVAPDAYAIKHNGRWQVSLSPGCQPRLSINQHYAALIARAKRDDANYLRSQLQEARWLIKSLQTRADTLLKVATAIVRAQEAYLEFGPEAMRPLVLKDVADEIGMHESTVSRVTTRKYLHTPRGTFEFKYFFSSGVTTIDGGAASATAIQAMIRKLVADERPERPLSDQALTSELNNRGINVARRTVAKYREAMNIPSSNDRARLS
ncbi:RNA polymerase sigma-54 factor RpoN [Dokdonella koreensis DS-123]|uniref:RNA polymerase sigma-54 factor n=2 Tax=Dokdonella TaxID=323413 RepID=A0A160DTL3_9GAMM|nr:RNA polymerase sigma-54 factor RpoN [Dokdonella koreensis DS-123]